jgi:hypothetical protein
VTSCNTSDWRRRAAATWCRLHCLRENFGCSGRKRLRIRNGRGLFMPDFPVCAWSEHAAPAQATCAVCRALPAMVGSLTLSAEPNRFMPDRDRLRAPVFEAGTGVTPRLSPPFHSSPERPRHLRQWHIAEGLRAGICPGHALPGGHEIYQFVDVSQTFLITPDLRITKY